LFYVSFLHRGGVAFTIGKGISSLKLSHVILYHVIQTRCDTGGEHDYSILTIAFGSHFEIPLAYGLLLDDDNDALYVKNNAEVKIFDSYFLFGNKKNFHMISEKKEPMSNTLIYC
jgi:hypothetical protein